jgi:uncharacterized membrane protein (DUF106 family)
MQLEILRNFKESMKDFKRVMIELAQDMHLKKLKKIKEKIEVLENYQSRSTIVNQSPILMFSQLFLMKCRICKFFTNSTWFDHSFAYYGDQEKTRRNR